ncbi:MAG: tyrosine-type recombinase/integrase [Nanoarchaeota archaeon]|nr:tyrosine-type recombinase/integrase [Nanoarchaeota archaeon]
MNFNEFEKEMKLRGFTRRTIDTYLFYNYRFLRFIGKSPREISGYDIKQYLNYLIEKRHAKPRTVNLAISALKFYYEIFSNKRLFSRISKCKEEKLLPRVLSKVEIFRMINATENEKHKLLIELMYSSGLRVSECVKLKINDVHIDRKVGIVRRGKGKKDRLFLLSDKFLKDLNEYVENRTNDNDYVFNDYDNGHITIRNAQRIVKNAARKAEIKKRVHCHMLRASFATHLLEDGVNESYIQKLMGHVSKKTLERYLAVRVDEALKVKSPLDNL